MRFRSLGVGHLTILSEAGVLDPTCSRTPNHCCDHASGQLEWHEQVAPDPIGENHDGRSQTPGGEELTLCPGEAYDPGHVRSQKTNERQWSYGQRGGQSHQGHDRQWNGTADGCAHSQSRSGSRAQWQDFQSSHQRCEHHAEHYRQDHQPGA